MVVEQQAVGLDVTAACWQVELEEDRLSGGREVESADRGLEGAVALEQQVHAVSCWVCAPDSDVQTAIVISIV